MTTNDDDWVPRAATWDEIETGFHEYAAGLTKQELEWDWAQTSFPPEFADWKVGMAAARKWLAAHDARVRRDAAREAEAERDEWRQTALDERGAALDALEQVKVRDARIKAVRDVLDRWQVSGYDALLRRIRRALNGYTET